MQRENEEFEWTKLDDFSASEVVTTQSRGKTIVRFPTRHFGEDSELLERMLLLSAEALEGEW